MFLMLCFFCKILTAFSRCVFLFSLHVLPLLHSHTSSLLRRARGVELCFVIHYLSLTWESFAKNSNKPPQNSLSLSLSTSISPLAQSHFRRSSFLKGPPLPIKVKTCKKKAILMKKEKQIRQT